jgi:hypothetical protein
LHLANEFAYAAHPHTARIVIMNCGGGITQKRIQKLLRYKDEGMRVEILEIPSIEEMVKIIAKVNEELSQPQPSPEKVFIGIDMMVLLLMAK